MAMKKAPPVSEADLFRWMLSENLNHIIRFHNSLQALLRERLNASANADPVLRSTIERYDKMNSANSLLIAYGFLEEMLILFWRRCFPLDAIPAGPSIARYKKKLLVDKLGLDLGTMPCWDVLQDVTKVRHCLLHTNGRISLMKDPNAIRATITRYPNALEEHLDRVSVTSFFLQRGVVAIRELRDAMLNG